MNQEIITAALAPDWDEEDYDDEADADGDDDDELDDDGDDEARLLGAQLWEDIQKANRASTQETEATIVPGVPGSSQEAALHTIRTILGYAEKYAVISAALTATKVPVEDENLLNALQKISLSGRVPKDIALPLSRSLAALSAQVQTSSILDPPLDPTNKRKRDSEDEGRPVEKRPYAPTDLSTRVKGAVHVVSTSLTMPSDPPVPIKLLVSSIEQPLHELFLFAVTSCTKESQYMRLLQEVSALIQVLGVVSGIQIGKSNSSPEHTPLPDIGTAVYPCLELGCRKTFSRLYNLRAHQNTHTSNRPFRCKKCPASFARNHDLKRHAGLHEKKAWKCSGCAKIFSRRDAIKRHRNGAKNRGPKAVACIDADEIEVPSPDVDETMREERRAKLWTGIGTATTIGESGVEIGEIDPYLLADLQDDVQRLHEPLHSYVLSALGRPVATLSDPGRITPDPNARSSSANGVPPVPSPSNAPPPLNGGPATSFVMYGLTDEQTKLLELAIANAASAAQAQAEAEAAREEDDERLGPESEEEEEDADADAEADDIDMDADGDADADADSDHEAAATVSTDK